MSKPHSESVSPREVVAPSSKPKRWFTIGTLVTYLVMVSLGITGSSISTASLNSEGGDANVLLGEPRSIRSDEYLRITPWTLGTMLQKPDHFDTPLAEDPTLATRTPTGGFIETIVFLDGTILQRLGPFLPDSLLFAAYWWMPFLIVLLAMPRWLELLGVRRHLSLSAAIIVVLSPSVAWWSQWPLLPTAWAASAAVLLLLATERAIENKALDVGVLLLAAASGLLITRTAFEYFPWAFVIGASILIPTAAVMIVRDGKRPVAVLAVSLAIAALAGLGMAAQNAGALQSLLETVYPGTRIVSSSVLSPGFLLGAEHLAILKADPVLATLNQSEVSSAYTILLLPMALLLARVPFRNLRQWNRSVPILALSAIVFVYLMWVTTELPLALGEHIPGLNRVPPKRLGQVIGIPITVLFFMVLDWYDRWEPRGRSRLPLAGAIAASTLLASVWAGTILRGTEIPSLNRGTIWLTSVILAAGIFVAVRWTESRLSILPLAAGAFGIVFLVNPFTVGLGQLRSGPAAERLRTEAALAGKDALWAADGLDTSALLLANAIPAISGQQWTGPDSDAWHVLDPEGQFEEEWNRGASYLIVRPWEAGSDLRVLTPNPDIIEIRVDPCDYRLDLFKVTRMITTEPLASDCLAPLGQFELGSLTRYLYSRVPPDIP